MAKPAYPIRLDLSKIGNKAENRPAKPTTQRDLDRHARMQGEEAKESGVMKKPKKYAKGGSVSSRADGVAKKGKTNCKMPKMAKGGMMKGCK